MRYLIVTLTCFCGVHCGYAGRETLSWDAVTIYKTNATVAALNEQANNATTNDTERSLAIFALFANHIKPGQTAAEIHRVLTNTAWLGQVWLYGVYDQAGWMPVKINSEDTVFCLGLFPHKKKWSDWPSASAAPQGVMADTEPRTEWVIYFRLSGSPRLSKEDAMAFLRGRPVAGNPKIVEFALWYPYFLPTLSRIPSRIERFGKYGIHAYDPVEDILSAATGTNGVSPLRR